MYLLYSIFISLSIIPTTLVGQQLGCTDESAFNYDMMADEPCNEIGTDNDFSKFDTHHTLHLL